jgi:hypothetical protein
MFCNFYLENNPELANNVTTNKAKEK